MRTTAHDRHADVSHTYLSIYSAYKQSAVLSTALPADAGAMKGTAVVQSANQSAADLVKQLTATHACSARRVERDLTYTRAATEASSTPISVKNAMPAAPVFGSSVTLRTFLTA